MFVAIINRLGQTFLVVVLVSVIVFSLTALLPGDPTTTILGEQATPGQREQARQDYGLDDPIPIRFVRWAARSITGDLGRSLFTNEPVLTMLGERLPVTLELSGISILIALLIGIPAGIVSARLRNSAADVIVTFLAVGMMAVPYFWMGILVIMFFSVELGYLPPSGYVPFSRDPLGNLLHMVLPSLTIGMGFAALIMRQTRAAMLQVLTQDFVRTARAKGQSEARVVIFHALRNALIPVITVVGLQVGSLLGGAVVTETVFSLPGIGRLLIDGIFQRDFPVIQGCVLFIVVSVILANLIADICYLLADPRIRNT